MAARLYEDIPAANGGRMEGDSSMREDSDVIDRLRSGDEQAFRTFVAKYQQSLISVAQTFVGNRATAEEVVQDTWLAAIEGLAAFEERSSLKNWVFAILANKARTRAVRDVRMVAAGSMSGEIDDDEPVVDQSRFDASGGWAQPPASWDHVTPERVVAGKQMWAHVEEAINRLPPAQRAVIVLRHVEEMDSDEVQEILGITAANQRVLLHRARAQVREDVEQQLEGNAGQMQSTDNFKSRTARTAATQRPARL